MLLQSTRLPTFPVPFPPFPWTDHHHQSRSLPPLQPTLHSTRGGSPIPPYNLARSTMALQPFSRIPVHTNSHSPVWRMESPHGPQMDKGWRGNGGKQISLYADFEFPSPPSSSSCGSSFLFDQTLPSGSLPPSSYLLSEAASGRSYRNRKTRPATLGNSLF